MVYSFLYSIIQSTGLSAVRFGAKLQNIEVSKEWRRYNELLKSQLTKF